MAGNIRWEGNPGVLNAGLASDLDSLADLAISVASAAIDNESSNYDTHMDIELILASADLSAVTNPSVQVHLLESVDGGTAFVDGGVSGSTQTANHPAGDTICAVLGLYAATAAMARVAARTMIPISPGRFKLAVLNRTGAAFGASGNTLKYRTYQIGYT